MAICALVAATVATGGAEAQRNRRSPRVPEQVPPTESVAPEDAPIPGERRVKTKFTFVLED